MNGYIEYPGHYLSGSDCPVGIAFAVESYQGRITPNLEASQGGWFKELPDNMQNEQKEFLKGLSGKGG